MSDLIFVPWIVLCFVGGAIKLNLDLRRTKREDRRPSAGDYAAGVTAIGCGIAGLLYLTLA